MDFRGDRHDEPEINLIPFIDVLLVILIFLMLSTTYSRYSELQITLPTADADKLAERPAEILVSVAADGRYAINKVPLDGRSIELLTAALSRAAGPAAATPAAEVHRALSGGPRVRWGARQSASDAAPCARRPIQAASGGRRPGRGSSGRTSAPGWR